MKSSTKESIIMYSILAVILLIILGIGYAAFGPKKTTGLITTDIKIIDKSYLEEKKSQGYSGQNFAVKAEGGKNQLVVYMYASAKKSFIESTFDFNKKDFDSIEVDKTYWFNVKLYNKDDTESGKVLGIYTESPVR